jgi:hypothetical protein
VLLLLAELRARRAARNIKLINVAAPLNTPPFFSPPFSQSLSKETHDNK